MSTLRATTIKHESSSSNNIVLNSNGTITANNSIKPASVMVQGSGNSSSTSFTDMVSCTITPTQSTSHMLVIITGSVGGEDGNNNNNTGNGTMRLLRGTTQLGDSITGGATGGDMGYERFDQAIIDTNNHGGSAVTYTLQLKKGGGSHAHAYLSNSKGEGNSRIVVLEILQ